jgi:arabinoxylan arabinofuranohydrolase
MMNKSICYIFHELFFMVIPFCSSAQNPIISQRYTADPSALVYKDTLYIYASHDIDDQVGYLINDITCVSTTDMKNWTDHGEVFAAKQTTWAKNTWAPCAVARNGKIYLYFGDGNRSIGVAVSDSPTGPFVDIKGAPVITKNLPNANVPWCFDPSVLIDDDGQAYCSFGGSLAGTDGIENARIIKLNPDMMSTSGSAVTVDAPGYFEGSYLHSRTNNGVKKYYFSYFRNAGRSTIDYLMSDNPMTGWGKNGIAMRTPINNGSRNNSQACIFEFKEKWYTAYHNRKVAIDRNLTDISKQRSICVDALSYNADYTIKEVTTTEAGVAQVENVDPLQRNEAEKMAQQSYLLPGIETDSCKDVGKGRMLTAINDDDWIKIAGVDFKTGIGYFTARVASVLNGNSIELYLDNLDGKKIGTCAFESTSSLNNWLNKNCTITGASGVHDLYLKFKGGSGDNLFNFNYWQFSQSITTALPPITQVKDSIIIFPNPSNTGLFSISKAGSWKVYNLLGIKVLEGKGDRIDLSVFAKGIYTLQTETTTHKLIYQ